MPHLVLQYTANIKEKNNLQKLFSLLNPFLAETLSTDINGCKCRGIELNNYYIGAGDTVTDEQAFIHIELKILGGRDSASLRDLGMKVMNVARNFFADSLKKPSTQLSLEIIELSPHYFKFSSRNPDIQLIGGKV